MSANLSFSDCSMGWSFFVFFSSSEWRHLNESLLHWFSLFHRFVLHIATVISLTSSAQSCEKNSEQIQARHIRKLYWNIYVWKNVENCNIIWLFLCLKKLKHSFKLNLIMIGYHGFYYYKCLNFKSSTACWRRKVDLKMKRYI